MCGRSGVRFIDGVVITDLAASEGVCCGAAGFRRSEGSTVAFRAAAVVLATGGAGGLFHFNDNAPGSYGEGCALALDAGLELVDMEFVQFYPLIRADCGSKHMMLPAVFADPAKIINKSGEDLKEKYGLKSGSIARVMRDRFSRAIFKEIREGEGVDDAVLMDIRDIDTTNMLLSPASLRKFEKILDFRARPLKIRPAAHFTMGGVKTDAEGRTALQGLYAVGEVTGGLHGANRLGGNALSEAVVFGTRCGKALGGDLSPACSKSAFEASLEKLFEEKFRPHGTSGNTRPPISFKALREILWNKAGIIRSDKSLKETLAVIDRIMEWFRDSGPSEPVERLRLSPFRAAVLTARSIVIPAIERTESRGAHYREDYPEESASWLKNIHIGITKPGVPEIKRIVESGGPHDSTL
jgi:succinate dehydrogenase/fumarate reductase flavoprotein subunit